DGGRQRLELAEVGADAFGLSGDERAHPPSGDGHAPALEVLESRPDGGSRHPVVLREGVLAREAIAVGPFPSGDALAEVGGHGFGEGPRCRLPGHGGTIPPPLTTWRCASKLVRHARYSSDRRRHRRAPRPGASC